MEETLRKPKTLKEKEFAEAAYKIGMNNGWCSGRYAIRGIGCWAKQSYSKTCASWSR